MANSVDDIADKCDMVNKARLAIFLLASAGLVAAMTVCFQNCARVSATKHLGSIEPAEK